MILLPLIAIVLGPAVVLLFVPRGWLIATFASLMLVTTLAWWSVFGHSCSNVVFAFMDDAIAQSSVWATAITGVAKIVWEANRIELQRELRPLFTKWKLALAALPSGISVWLMVVMLVGGDPSCI